jgi:hypothetical protein
LRLDSIDCRWKETTTFQIIEDATGHFRPAGEQRLLDRRVRVHRGKRLACVGVAKEHAKHEKRAHRCDQSVLPAMTALHGRSPIRRIGSCNGETMLAQAAPERNGGANQAPRLLDLAIRLLCAILWLSEQHSPGELTYATVVGAENGAD